jgi:branched-chain amino acid transport system ATP-binding protein
VGIVTKAILEAKKIVKDFGRFRALDSVNIAVERGSLHAIIGPNGAGKTTFFNVITGGLRPASGKVFFNGMDITRWPAERRVYLGLGRAFQIVALFPDLTVLENLIIPIIMKNQKGMSMFYSPCGDKNMLDAAREILKTVELEEKAGLKAQALSHGDKKKLDIGIALACRPTLLVLDEPTSGLGPQETIAVIDLIKRLHAEKNTSVVFVEHNMSVVLSIARKITVLSEGRVIAEGTPDEIRKDKDVIEAYLGEEH